MSKIVDAIMYFDTGERRVLNKRFGTPLFHETVDIKSDYSDYSTNDYIQKVYRIEVKLGNTCLLNEEQLDYINEAVKRTKNQVVEAIFGEFREDFRMIERAIYEHDFNKAGQLLYKFEYKMFNVGE
jgi:hypothetical protein